MTLIELWAEKELLRQQHVALFSGEKMLDMATIEVGMDLGSASVEQQAEYLVWGLETTLVCARIAAVDELVRAATGHAPPGDRVK